MRRNHFGSTAAHSRTSTAFATGHIAHVNRNPDAPMSRTAHTNHFDAMVGGNSITTNGGRSTN